MADFEDSLAFRFCITIYGKFMKIPFLVVARVDWVELKHSSLPRVWEYHDFFIKNKKKLFTKTETFEFSEIKKIFCTMKSTFWY